MKACSEGANALKFEIEIKLRLPAKLAKIRRKLRAAGFRIAKRRMLESNVLFDDSKRSLRKHGKLIRVRYVGGDSVLTFKGPSERSRYKKRPEIDISLPRASGLDEILKEIGLRPVFRYEKFRTEFAKPRGTGKVMLDETPIGNFVEIEGSPSWIERTARLLGFSRADHITRSYGYLYSAHCRERRIPAKDMLFTDKRLNKPPRKSRQ